MLLAFAVPVTGSVLALSRDATFLACLSSCFFFFAISRWRFSKE